MIIIPNTGSYYGGKNGSGVYQAIINQIPPHKVYIEPFLGKGAIMRYKKPAPVYNIGCELDEDLINSFRNPAIKEQGLNIIVNHKNGIDFLHDVGHGETFIQYGKEVFVYCDPPYLIESRKTPRARYKHEFLRADHIEFLDVVTRLQLHDYSYLGKTFRERERIRKKLQRHVQGLKRLPIFERKAIIEAIVNI